MEVVLDTSLLVSGLRSSRGASHRLLRLVDDGALVPVASTALFLEYEAVLKRPEQMLAHGFSLADIDMFLAGFAALVKAVEVHFRWRPQLRDPADEFVLEAALGGGCRWLVTHNVRDFAPVAATFDLTVVAPGQLLKILEDMK